MQRIVIVGTTGSGKTTLARHLTSKRHIPHVELDALNWGPNWTQADTETFRQRTDLALSGECWVVDGNYSKLRDIVWKRADTLIWLDYSLPIILWRLIIRTLKRIIWREELWSGNRESFSAQFLSRDSLLLWALQSYRRRRREYPLALQRPEYRHLVVIRHQSPRETRKWLAEVREV